MFKNVLFVVVMFAMSDFMFAASPPTALQKITGVKEYKYEQKTAGKINYYEVKKNENDVAGYIFDSGGLTDEIRGYAGPMRLLIYVDTAGNVKNFQVSESSETPRYLAKVMNNKSRYIGKNIFQADKVKFDAVTGATYSSNAIAKILKQAGTAFAALIAVNKNAATDNVSTKTETTVTNTPPSRESRKIDTAKYQSMIKENKLSDKPAVYNSVEK